MDIVVYIRDGENEELRYAIRSWCKNLVFDKLVVVGGPKPNWLNPDIYLEVKPTLRMMHQCNKNLKTALSDSRVSNDVLILMDDVFILDYIGEWRRNLNRGLLKEHINKTYKKFGNTPYALQLKKTYALIGKPKALSYENHSPFICNKSKMFNLLTSIPTGNIDYTLFRSLYGNKYISDSIFMEDIKLHSKNDNTNGEYKIISTNEESFSGKAGDYIKAIFPQKSRYEI